MSYIDQSTKREDVRSTAYTFLLVGVAGLVLIILIDTGVIQLQLADYMRIMTTLVMGGMFIAFIIVGILSFAQLKKLNQSVTTEADMTARITDWFLGTYTAAGIDEAAVTEEDTPQAQLYYDRYDFMKSAILEQFPDIQEDFLDHMIEVLYEQLF